MLFLTLLEDQNSSPETYFGNARRLNADRLLTCVEMRLRRTTTFKRFLFRQTLSIFPEGNTRGFKHFDICLLTIKAGVICGLGTMCNDVYYRSIYYRP